MDSPLRLQVPAWLQRAAWHAGNLAWTGQWRVIRAAATPWVKEQYRTARAKLLGDPKPAPIDAVAVDRETLDAWLQGAAPPGVPFHAVVLPSSVLRSRFGDGPTERRSLHMAR